MQDFLDKINSYAVPNQFIAEFPGGIELWLKREDLLHPEVSGNKFRKLKYNLLAAQNLGSRAILTFGGAHSNHIAATAAAGKIMNLPTIGIIRGEELKNSQEKWSPTLAYAHSCGMKFEFVSREIYRDKDTSSFRDKLYSKYADVFILPEGGTNALAIRGCEEILLETDNEFNFICTSVGTGGTLAGLINASEKYQTLLGFSALKTEYLRNEVSELVQKKNWKIILDYHFGGYAKMNAELINFMNDFNKKYKIILDPVYTGKLVFGIFDLINKGFFPERSKILAIHTGGLQGIEGMNQFLKKKELPQINY